MTLVLTVVSGCGGSGASPKPTASASPTEKQGAIVGKGYSFDPPTGWRRATARFRKARPQTDQAAIAPQERDYLDNVTVVVASAGTQKGDRASLGPVARKALTGGKVTDIRIPPDTTDIDGRPATRATGRTEVGGDAVHLVQLYVVHDKQLTVITFAFGDQTSETDREAEIKQTLASWTWS